MNDSKSVEKLNAADYLAHNIDSFKRRLVVLEDQTMLRSLSQVFLLQLPKRYVALLNSKINELQVKISSCDVSFNASASFTKESDYVGMTLMFGQV